MFGQRRKCARSQANSIRLRLETLEDRRTPATVLDPNLEVNPVASGLTTPISMAFLGEDDFLILEKNTGKVKRIVDGAVQSTVLDLAVNFGSERGLLGIALHPQFPTNNSVYLFWTESTSGGDTGTLSATTLLGNRVDRFTWDGSKLTMAQNLIHLRAIQEDGAALPPNQGDLGQPERGNHDGGVLRFGADGKLYVIFGDVGRRGQLQNLPSGPTPTGLGPTVPDDQFGGPQPDDAHFSGVILRLNPDGSTPNDNPFFSAGAKIGGEVGGNIQQIFAYGIRNSFGMDVDPQSGSLWYQDNGEDAYDELNRVEPGMNGGWIQIMGPLSRVPDYRQIETTSLHHEDTPNLQQLRWGPENIATTSAEAKSRLFDIPGSKYSDPEFSWKHVLAPAGIGFLNSKALGPQFNGDLFVGFSTTDTLGGPLFRFNLTGNRNNVATDDPRLADRVADNLTFHDITESESLVIGKDFGILTDIRTGPNGNLFVVSLDQGTVFEVSRRQNPGQGNGQPGSPGNNKQSTFVTRLSGDQEVPPRDTKAHGHATFRLNSDETELQFRLHVANIDNVVAAHLHLGAVGVNGPVVVGLFEGPTGSGRTNGVLSTGTITAADLTGPLAGQPLSALIDLIESGQIYLNVHTNDGVGAIDTGPGDFPGGEIRGQLGGADASSVQLRSDAADAPAQTTVFVTRLSGDQEVPPRDTRARGHATFQLSSDGTELQFRLNVANIDNVFAAHLHSGVVGENGAVVVGLFDGPTGSGRTNGVLSTGTITAADLTGPLAGQPLSALIDLMESGGIYLNVHTNDGVGVPNSGPGDFPGGEIRGQLGVAGPSSVQLSFDAAPTSQSALIAAADRGKIQLRINDDDVKTQSRLDRTQY